MFKVRIIRNIDHPDLDAFGCYSGVDKLGLDKNGLILWNEDTENKVCVPIEEEDAILIFPERRKQ